MTKTGQVINSTKKGLKGFNKFVNKYPGGPTATEGLPKGTTWQKRASRLYQTNKVDKQGLKHSDKGLSTLGIISIINQELEK